MKKCPGDCSKCRICEQELQAMFGYDYTEEDLNIHRKERKEFEKIRLPFPIHNILVSICYFSVFVYHVGKYVAPFFFYGCISLGIYKYFNENSESLFATITYYPLFFYSSIFFFLGYLLLDKFKLLDYD